MCVCISTHMGRSTYIMGIEEDLFILNIISPRIFYLFICRRERKEEKIEKKKKRQEKGQSGQWSRNAACAPGPTGPTTF